MSAEQDTTGWAEAHQACFEIDPLIEMRGAEKIQVGFTLELYARLPMEGGPGPERRQSGAAVWERLRTILESVLPREGGSARLEIEPRRMAAVLRPESQMEPEVTLRARIFHADDLWKAVTPGDRAGLEAFSKKLVAVGLKAGHW
jgi:hypothetical protein